MDRRKILLIFAAAWVSAALLTWFLYASTKTPRVEKTIAILAAAHDMAAGTRLRKGDLKMIHVPERDVPKLAILDEKQALDRPVLFPVSANEPITLSKVASVAGAEGLPATIEIGKRAIAVPITDASGVAGSAEQADVAGEQRRPEQLGQCHVRRVVGRQVETERPDAGQQHLVGVTLDRQIGEIP